MSQILYIWTPKFTLVKPLVLLFSNAFCEFVFSCFSGHEEKIVSILTELDSKRKEDLFFFAWKYIDSCFLYMDVEDIKSINVELAAM